MKMKRIICWILGHKLKFEKFDEKKQCARCGNWFEPTYDFFQSGIKKSSMES